MSGALPEPCLLPSAASSPRAIRPLSAPLVLWQAVRSQLSHLPLSCPCTFPQALLWVWDRAAPSGAISATSSPCRVKPSPCQSQEQVCPGLAEALLPAREAFSELLALRSHVSPWAF